jgi:hypothetical protein
MIQHFQNPIERGKNTQIHGRSLSLLDTVTAIKRDGVKPDTIL